MDARSILRNIIPSSQRSSSRCPPFRPRTIESRYGASTRSPRRWGQRRSFHPTWSIREEVSRRPASSPRHGEKFQQKPGVEMVEDEKDNEIHRPWHRAGSDDPPVERSSSDRSLNKGKLLTTPSRLLKLILPLCKANSGSDRQDAEPLALLVHPQQPLSYLERLIQSELPTIRNSRGEGKVPAIYFRAEDPGHDSLLAVGGRTVEDKDAEVERLNPNLETTEVGGDTVKTGKLGRSKAQQLRGGPGEGGVETYGSLGPTDPASSQNGSRKFFVRWSASTEIGDFIRDAARGSEFAIEIEGSPKPPILVGVPSFDDRTHYLRKRLRKLSREITSMAAIKTECDQAAFRGARRVAMGGFGLLVGWWYMVYWLTFQTSKGWDLAEPLTYLVGLTTVMCGYLWFLFNNREVSYRAALSLTINRRQNKLYQTHGLDLDRWESLIEEAKAVRKDIKAVAHEYNVEWDEKADEQNEKIIEVLEKDGKDDDDDDDHLVDEPDRGRRKSKKQIRL